MAAANKCSFQKRGSAKNTIIKGTKPSLHNSQLLISSGIPSLDALMGGGIPVGSLILINEDEYGTYAKFFLRYFLAEGILSNHSCLIASQNDDPQKMAQQLPCPVDSDIDDEVQNETTEKKMTIAWRYENLKAVSAFHNHSHFGHYFDLSRNIQPEVIDKSNIEYWSGFPETSANSFETTHYGHLLKVIRERLKNGKHFAKEKVSNRNILRIVLHQLDSPLWHYDCESDKNHTYLYMFLYSLRALLRNAYSACFITLPFRNYQFSHLEKCIHFCDIALQLQSFAGRKYEHESPYKDYHGFLIIQKLAAINSMLAFHPGITNLAFKLRRKKFIIEEFHLPPESEDTVEREQNESSVLTCSSKSSHLDF